MQNNKYHSYTLFAYFYSHGARLSHEKAGGWINFEFEFEFEFELPPRFPVRTVKNNLASQVRIVLCLVGFDFRG